MQRQILRASCALSILATSFFFVQGHRGTKCEEQSTESDYGKEYFEGIIKEIGRKCVKCLDD